MAEIDVLNKIDDVLNKLDDVLEKIDEDRIIYDFCIHCNGDGLNEPSVGGPCAKCSGSGEKIHGRLKKD